MAVCVSFSSLGGPIGVHILPRVTEVRDLQESVSVQAAAAKSEKVSAAAERAVGDLLISLFSPASACHGQGLPRIAESVFGVPPW